MSSDITAATTRKDVTDTVFQILTDAGIPDTLLLEHTENP